MKIDLNVNAMAVTPQPSKAVAENSGGDDFERMLEDASKAAEPPAEQATEQPQEQVTETAEAQKAAPDEVDAQELPQEPAADEEQESAEAVPVEANFDVPVVTVAGTPVVTADAVTDDAEEMAKAVVQANAASAPGSGDPGHLSAESAPIKVAAEGEVEVAPHKQAGNGAAEAKPQAAAMQVAADSVEPDAEAVVNQATYKPVVIAKPQVAEGGAEAKMDAATMTAPQADNPAISAGETSQQPAQQQTSSQRDDAPAHVSADAKPQAVETADAPQAFNASPTPPGAGAGAGPGVQVEAAAPNANIEAAPPASAMAANEAPRPTNAAGAAASQQALHAQRQERDEQRVAEQALRAMRSVVNQRGGSLTLRLNPPELGDLRIRLEMTQHVVSARLETSTDAVRQLLQQQLPQLHSALSSHGLTVDQIQVQTQQAAAPDGQRGAQHQHSGGSEDGRSRGGFERQHQRGEDRRPQQQDELSRFQRELLDLVA